MTQALVIDASVAYKWLADLPDEPLRAEADALLERILAGSLQGIVPDLFWCEIANAIRKAVVRKRFSVGVAMAHFDGLISFELTTRETGSVIANALDLALTCDHPVYDCIYVELARSLGIEMITADEVLVRKLGSRHPLRWLGALY